MPRLQEALRRQAARTRRGHRSGTGERTESHLIDVDGLSRRKTQIGMGQSRSHRRASLHNFRDLAAQTRRAARIARRHTCRGFRRCLPSLDISRKISGNAVEPVRVSYRALIVR